MNASGGDGVKGLVGYILEFIVKRKERLESISLFYEYLRVYLIIGYGFLPFIAMVFVVAESAALKCKRKFSTNYSSLHLLWFEQFSLTC